jgi:hypothetical protein
MMTKIKIEGDLNQGFVVILEAQLIGRCDEKSTDISWITETTNNTSVSNGKFFQIQYENIEPLLSNELDSNVTVSENDTEELICTTVKPNNLASECSQEEVKATVTFNVTRKYYFM